MPSPLPDTPQFFYENERNVKRYWRRSQRRGFSPRERTIKAAFDAGVSAADIAMAFGLTHQRVYQIVKNRRSGYVS